MVVVIALIIGLIIFLVIFLSLSHTPWAQMFIV